MPSSHLLDQCRITEPEKMMRAGVGGDVRHQFKIVPFSKWNIPGNAPAEPTIANGCFARVPGEEDFDRIAASRAKPLVKRSIVLYRVRNNDR
jgi:hypothetical protein